MVHVSKKKGQRSKKKGQHDKASQVAAKKRAEAKQRQALDARASRKPGKCSLVMPDLTFVFANRVCNNES